MNTEAKLRLLFNNYNSSSKATKSFINYFMNNAVFHVGMDTDHNSPRLEAFTNIPEHLNGQYEFIIDEDIDGQYAVATHEADDNFNFSLSATIASMDSIYNDDCSVRIKRSNDSGKIVLSLIIVGEEHFVYEVDKTKWSSEYLNKLFPAGAPSEVDINSIKDFEPLLINEDWVDEVNPRKGKIKDYFVLSGDSFDKEAITVEDSLDMIFYGGADKIDSNICMVTGSLSNTESGESLEFNKEMMKLQRDGSKFKLIIKSDKEFNKADLDVTCFSDLKLYGSVTQEHTSNLSSYSLQIPLQDNGQYIINTDKKLWHSEESYNNAIGMSFKDLNIGNLATDKVKLVFTKGESVATYRYIREGEGVANLAVKAIELYGEGDNISLKIMQSNGLWVYLYDKRISESDPVIRAKKVIPDGAPYKLTGEELVALVDSADQSKVIGQYISADGYVTVLETDTSAKPIQIQLANGAYPKASISFYLNDVLYAKSNGEKTFNKIYEDKHWPATLSYSAINKVRGGSGAVKMIRYNEDGSIADSGAVFSEFCTLHNYNGTLGYIYLDLDEVQEVEYNFVPVENGYIEGYNTNCSTLRADFENKTQNSCLRVFNVKQEWGNRPLFENKENIDIPVSVKVVSVSGEELDKNTAPYRLIIDKDMYNQSKGENIELSSPNGKITYSLKTPIFTLTENVGDEITLTNAYYKLGIFALDGTNESSDKLAEDFLNKCCLSVQKRSWYGNYDKNYVFVIKPKEADNDTFYTVSDKYIMHDKSSQIILSNNKASTHYMVSHTALLPLVEVSNNRSEKILKGFIYMDLFNADDGAQITESLTSNINPIMVNGEDASNKDIIIEKIKD